MTGQTRGILAHTPDSQTLKIKNMGEEIFNHIADLITAKTIFCTKEVLTSDEAASYMGVSKSYLYKLTMRKQIPHYKPMGKMCYFDRLELEKWLRNNRCATDSELNERAARYMERKVKAL